MDQLARAEDLQAKLEDTDWDLVVVDEAHKMSANWFGNKALTKPNAINLENSLAEEPETFSS